jgi:cullin-associated NEDD8-dissociated protein 1
VIGEIGRRMDLSSLGHIVEKVEELFGDDNIEIRSAASHCLGSISIGNVGFFFPKIMHLVGSNATHKYLLLLSVKEVIQAHREELDQLDELTEVLFQNAKSDEENIRNVVSECLGRLFVKHGT